MMASGGAEPRTTLPGQAAASTPWESLGRRQVAELAVPGVAIGLLGGVIAGGLAAFGGLALDVALIAGVALAAPLAIAGAGYEVLLARGRLAMGVLTPVVLYWAAAFPVVRVLDAAMLNLYAGADVAVPYGWLDFVLYQMLLSLAFGIGYWWLHENFAPRWWFHLRDRNPVANHFIRFQLEYAAAAEQERDRRRAAAGARSSRRSRR